MKQFVVSLILFFGFVATAHTITLAINLETANDLFSTIDKALSDCELYLSEPQTYVGNDKDIVRRLNDECIRDIMDTIVFFYVKKAAMSAPDGADLLDITGEISFDKVRFYYSHGDPINANEQSNSMVESDSNDSDDIRLETVCTSIWTFTYKSSERKWSILCGTNYVGDRATQFADIHRVPSIFSKWRICRTINTECEKKILPDPYIINVVYTLKAESGTSPRILSLVLNGAGSLTLAHLKFHWRDDIFLNMSVKK